MTSKPTVFDASALVGCIRPKREEVLHVGYLLIIVVQPSTHGDKESKGIDMSTLFTLVLMVVAIAIFSIVLLAAFGLPVAFAGTISALCVGSVTAAVRFWPSDKAE